VTEPASSHIRPTSLYLHHHHLLYLRSTTEGLCPLACGLVVLLGTLSLETLLEVLASIGLASITKLCDYVQSLDLVGRQNRHHQPSQ
jgi:hypothetical protein